MSIFLFVCTRISPVLIRRPAVTNKWPLQQGKKVIISIKIGFGIFEAHWIVRFKLVRLFSPVISDSKLIIVLLINQFRQLFLLIQFRL